MKFKFKKVAFKFKKVTFKLIKIIFKFKKVIIKLKNSTSNLKKSHSNLKKIWIFPQNYPKWTKTLIADSYCRHIYCRILLSILNYFQLCILDSYCRLGSFLVNDLRNFFENHEKRWPKFFFSSNFNEKIVGYEIDDFRRIKNYF